MNVTEIKKSNGVDYTKWTYAFDSVKMTMEKDGYELTENLLEADMQSAYNADLTVEEAIEKLLKPNDELEHKQVILNEIDTALVLNTIASIGKMAAHKLDCALYGKDIVNDEDITVVTSYPGFEMVSGESGEFGAVYFFLAARVTEAYRRLHERIVASTSEDDLAEKLASITMDIALQLLRGYIELKSKEEGE